ncbi:MAG TPA: hypothetical protein VFI18_03360 [Gaiellales bacterium]|nr:hypothetical protein [Gaiellales bacterium]
MTRRHRLVPTFVAALAAAAVIAPTAQARPAASGGGTDAVVVDRTVHDQPLANPVAVPANGLNHGAGFVDRTRPIQVDSSGGTSWGDVLSGAAAGALVIAVFATGLGTNRRANPAT